MNKPAKKYHHTVYQLIVLSEDPYDQTDLQEIHYDTDSGDCVGGFNLVKQEVLTAEQMVAALYAAGSEPGFFGLDDQGNEINEDDDEEQDSRDEKNNLYGPDPGEPR